MQFLIGGQVVLLELLRIGNPESFKLKVESLFPSCLNRSPLIPIKTFIIAPIDLIKTQMQVQCIGKRMNSDYMGWRGTVRHIYRHAGLSGFTCGFMTCLGRFFQSIVIIKS